MSKVKSMSIGELQAKINALNNGQVHNCIKKDKKTGEETPYTVVGSSHADSKYYQDMVACLNNKLIRRAANKRA